MEESPSTTSEKRVASRIEWGHRAPNDATRQSMRKIAEHECSGYN